MGITTKKNSIKLKTFSNKYINYFEATKTNRVNCLEGSIRSGKTIVNICAFANYIDSCKSGDLFAVSGKTGGLAWTTVGECKGARTDDGAYGADEGFGLMYMFKGRCHKGVYGRIPCLYVKTKLGKKVAIIFVGAYNKGAKEALRGLTISGWLATELYNHRVDDDDDFIDFMLGRMLLGETKIFWDLNPTYPTHKVYLKYLDIYLKKFREGKFNGGYNYVHCTLIDNTTITEEKLAEILNGYSDKTSVSYKRDILGLRACSSGLIFGQFASSKDNWIVKDLKTFLQTNTIDKIRIGVDFGDNKSATTFVASATINKASGVLVLASAKLDMENGTVDTRKMRDSFKSFVQRVLRLNVGKPFFVYCDCASNVLTNEIRNAIKELALPFGVTVNPCYKAAIRKRIDCKNMMLNYNRWFVYYEAISVIESTESLVWDSRDGHEDERLDDGSCDVDTADAEEYSWECQLDLLAKNCSRL